MATQALVIAVFANREGIGPTPRALLLRLLERLGRKRHGNAATGILVPPRKHVIGPRIHVCIGAGKCERNVTQNASLVRAAMDVLTKVAYILPKGLRDIIDEPFVGTPPSLGKATSKFRH